MEDAGHPAGAIVVYVWHVERTGTSPDELTALPLHRIVGVEVDEADRAVVGTLFEDIGTGALLRRRLLDLPHDGGNSCERPFCGRPVGATSLTPQGPGHVTEHSILRPRTPAAMRWSCFTYNNAGTWLMRGLVTQPAGPGLNRPIRRSSLTPVSPKHEGH